MLVAMENLLVCAFKLYSWRHGANLDTSNLLNPSLPDYHPPFFACILDSWAGQSNIAIIDVTTLNDPGFTPMQGVLGFYSLE